MFWVCFWFFNVWIYRRFDLRGDVCCTVSCWLTVTTWLMGSRVTGTDFHGSCTGWCYAAPRAEAPTFLYTWETEVVPLCKTQRALAPHVLRHTVLLFGIAENRKHLHVNNRWVAPPCCFERISQNITCLEGRLERFISFMASFKHTGTINVRRVRGSTWACGWTGLIHWETLGRRSPKSP